MQLPTKVRNEYPSGTILIGIYSPFKDVNYSKDDVYEVVSCGMLHIICTALYGLINLGYFKKQFKRLHKCCEIIFIASTSLVLYILFNQILSEKNNNII